MLWMLSPLFYSLISWFRHGTNYGSLTLGNTLIILHSVFLAGSLENSSLACDVSVLCLKNASSGIDDNIERCNILASMIFPLLLVLPKVLFFSVWILNYIYYTAILALIWYPVNCLSNKSNFLLIDLCFTKYRHRG